MENYLKFFRAMVRKRIKILRIMKLTMIFLLIGMLQVSANVYSQNGKINVEVNKMELSDLLWQLQEESGIVFVYKTRDLKGIEKVTVSKENSSIEEILDEVLEDTDLEYKLNDDVVVIKRKEAQPSIQQQDKTINIKGKVVDEKGVTLPGVSVFIKSTRNGTATDLNGQFQLQVPKGDVTLVFSFIGMVTQEVQVGKDLNLKIVLLKDEKEIEEVVVTGIFNRKASTFTGAVSSFSGEELLVMSKNNVLESLKLLDPSMLVVQDLANGSDPNAQSEILIRGSSTFDLQETASNNLYKTGANAPLLMLDGFETNIEKIEDLDPNRVISITILKDASAKAIYGSKAANGVIIIETKVDPDGAALITYDALASFEVPDLSSYNLMNAQEKLDFEMQMNIFEGVDGLKTYMQRQKNIDEGVDTDWLAKPTHVGIGQRHRLGFQLGLDAVRVVGGLTYNDVQGAMKGSNRKTITGDLTLSYRIKNLKIKNQMSVTTGESNNSPYGQFSSYAAMNPYDSPYDRNGNLVANVNTREYADLGYYDATKFTANPLYNAYLNTVDQTTYIDFTNNTSLEYRFKNYMKVTGRFGITLRTDQRDKFTPATHTMFLSYDEGAESRKGSYSLTEGDRTVFSGDLNMSYTREFNDRHFLMVGVQTSFSNSESRSTFLSAEGFPSAQMNDLLFADAYAQGSKPSGYESVKRDISLLSIVNYAYDNRYLFDATIRNTGSSQYGSNNRWGMFWSTGIGWNIHEEDWVGLDWIQKLKLRGSIGTTGAQISDSYAGIAAYEFIVSNTYRGFLGANLKDMRNDELKWQEKVDYNVGADINLFSNLSITFDVYKALTKNSIISQSLTPSQGFSSVDENVGEIENTGFDFKISYRVFSNPAKKAYFNIYASAAHNKNTIKKLSGAMNDYNDAIDAIYSENLTLQDATPLKKYYEGASTSAIWAMKSLGIDPSNGREIFIRKDGTRTYEYDATQQQVVGDALPDFNGSFGFSAGYKGFTASIGCYYTYGGQRYNSTLASKVESYDIARNVDRRVLEGTWEKPGDVKRFRQNPAYSGVATNVIVPEFYDIGNGTMVANDANYYYVAPGKPTDRFVADDNQISISNISLGYDFAKQNFVKKLGLERLRVAVNGNNIYSWSSIEIERGTAYPFARRFNFSLNATF